MKNPRIDKHCPELIGREGKVIMKVEVRVEVMTEEVRLVPPWR
jgi:hypothetical protein